MLAWIIIRLLPGLFHEDDEEVCDQSGIKNQDQEADSIHGTVHGEVDVQDASQLRHTPAVSEESRIWPRRNYS